VPRAHVQDLVDVIGERYIEVWGMTEGVADVPERTHAVLRQRAAAAHQSLQEYLRARLIEDADQPTLEEVLDRAGGRSGGSVPLRDAVAAIRDDRAGR
jgi:hypothetical protein